MKKLTMMVVMMVLAIQVVWAEADFRTEGDWTYKIIADGYCYLTRYNGTDTEITIPKSFEGGTVVVWEVKNLKPTVDETGYLYSVSVPTNIFEDTAGKLNHTVTKITLSTQRVSGFGAFKGCAALKSVVFEEGIVGLGEGAFDGCVSLETVDLPTTITAVTHKVFNGCTKLKSVLFKGNAPTIESNSFGRTMRDFRVFYRAGKTGFSARAYARWKPVILTAAGTYVLEVGEGTGGSVDNDGGDTVAIEAAAPVAGKVFRRWTGETRNVANVTASDTIVRMLADTISVKATYTADPDTSTKLTAGTLVDGDGTRRIIGTYYDPIRDPNSLKLRKTSMRVLRSGKAYWSRTLCLYDRRAFRKAYRNGIKFKYFKGQVKSLEIDIPALTGSFTMVPPTITSVSAVSVGNTVVIKGTHFGYRSPRVKIEYISRGRVRTINCRVLRPQVYADYNGRAGRSCMDTATGVSQITIQMPKRYPRDWVHGTYDLVLDNRIGMATSTVETQ